MMQLYPWFQMGPSKLKTTP